MPIGPRGSLERPAYAPGMYLMRDDRVVEQDYFRQRLRRHNRRLHSWGVVCGLSVVPAGDPRRPWGLYVCPGYALGPYGDEIVVPARVFVDVQDHLWASPVGVAPRVAHIAIRYAEHAVRPIPAPPGACGCDDTVYHASRIRESFRVDVLWALSDQPPEDDVDPCDAVPRPCPECPPSPYVWLACVRLPPSEGDPIPRDLIDNDKCRS